jgi:hypothetical protein
VVLRRSRLWPDAVTGRVEHVLQYPADFSRASGLGLAQVTFRVLERVTEHEETIADRFELLAGDDELVFTQTELDGATTGFVVALAA